MSNATYQLLTIAAQSDLQDILIAELSESGYEGFVQEDEKVIAYTSLDLTDENKSMLTNLLSKYNLTASDYKIETVAQQNWNAEWENNFEPVMIADTVYIRAIFHPENERAKHTITIQPKMSFGTGHHGTTSGVVEMMLPIDFKNKTVLDMGSGTGILAILAAQLGATDILAIDNDEWAVNNAKENFELNNCSFIKLELGDEKNITNKKFDIILSNITKNYNVANLPAYFNCLNEDGKILLSGFYEADNDEVIAAALPFFILEEQITNNNWSVLLFRKSK